MPLTNPRTPLARSTRCHKHQAPYSHPPFIPKSLWIPRQRCDNRACFSRCCAMRVRNLSPPQHATCNAPRVPASQLISSVGLTTVVFGDRFGVRFRGRPHWKFQTEGRERSRNVEKYPCIYSALPTNSTALTASETRWVTVLQKACGLPWAYGRDSTTHSSCSIALPWR